MEENHVGTTVLEENHVYHYSNRGKPRFYGFKEANNLNGNVHKRIFRPSKTKRAAPSQLYRTHRCLHQGFPLFTFTLVTSQG